MSGYHQPLLAFSHVRLNFELCTGTCRLSIGEGEDNRGGEREAGVKEGRVSGEKLNHIFHDLYVGMAQTAHQNHVLTHRLNRMEQIVSADDDNRAQIAQHIAGLRNSAEQVRASARSTTA